ncbi:single-stranded-DNA-specific exonuclease RecJ [Treponema brennaborense]|uniref:Single-stranded-DNA-specific exonuclease RecJ n=1 Tax=Treponema brennaborense (strain DSM 12168 / CIP 105900 / DD5/3) TaxID=906968 RepID=F4LKE6_TREBD|nr:single-stranded-DNA-specific exonuclease RecJ [Treponema brennaborense]AEE16520.1 single-stranded-DNA-specific exonuclease RecJ [Treponema brennaborense DSM 12168]
MLCNKKELSKEVVHELHKRFACDPLAASILARRGITTGEDIQYYLENDVRYLHSPFLFSAMEDAVDRILSAKDDGEKVLIFGDRDVDGITSTALLYRCLSGMGIDVQWRIPTGDDGYGLSLKAVEEFAADYGTLIITVDCGISNTTEIARAAELSVDVIVTDHHNPPEQLPPATIIINPKLADSGYPFKDISGCAVVYKLVSALRFSRNELYKQEICLLNVRPVNEAYVIECIKTVNMTEKARLTETITPGLVRIENTRLIPFLRGQQICVWDAELQQKQLAKIFGSGIEFNMLDIRNEIADAIPAVRGASLLRIREMSRILRYQDTPASELDGFFNIFVTFMQKKTADGEALRKNQFDLQLVMLAALADIMPLKNENRILVRQGLASINGGVLCPGLTELLARLNLLGKKLSSTDVSWNVVPVLNAAGRLGQPELAVKLFLSEDAKERDEIASRIIQLNKDRRQLGSDAWGYTEKQAYESFERFGRKLVVVVDERIHRGVSGILAANLVKAFNVPAIAVTFVEDGTAVGSMRSTRGYDVTELLAQCGDLFINHGGHNFAAGFSLVKENVVPFTERLAQLSSGIELGENDEKLPQADAEIPHEWLTPDLLKTVDLFEPFGEENPPLFFFSRKLKIIGADILGKTEKKHLKLTLAGGKTKWPALYWSAAERLGTDFNVGDTVDVLYQVNRNTFNGMETAQLIINALEKSR